MKRTNQLIFILIILIIALGSAIYFRSQDTQQPSVTPVLPVQQTQQPIKKPIVHYPISDQNPSLAEVVNTGNNNVAGTEKKPESNTESALSESINKEQNNNQSVDISLAALLKNNNTPELFIMDNFIQRFVATVDNLPEKKLPQNTLPLLPPKGKFIVSGTQEAPQTSTRNYQRYTPYIKILKAIDPHLAVTVYTRFYAMFQRAYEQLGYKNAYFNDRMVFVLDHLLETPNPADPLSLVQPVVFYTYANPEYENMSAGQKLLLRIGQKNRTTVLEILRDYRKLITNQQPVS